MDWNEVDRGVSIGCGWLEEDVSSLMRWVRVATLNAIWGECWCGECGQGYFDAW